MKTRTCWALVLAFVISTPLTTKAAVAFSAGIEIRSASDFYDPLQSYGDWITVGSYGRCWHPTVTLDAGWRPYSVGHWEWTDCGWYWASDEPWSWACYHYGYWAFDPQYGWVWIPGTEWAPAWVVWRESPDFSYIGWAPCGPGGVAISASLFCFVDAHHFHDSLRPGELIVNNTSLIQRTRVISGIDRETRSFDGRRERVVVNRGPDVSGIQRVTGRAFTARPIRDVVQSTPLPQPMLQRAEPWRRQNARTIQDQPQYRKNREVQPGRTGREQQPSTSPQTVPSTREERRNNLSPSGREQQRTYQQQPSSTVTPQPAAPARSYTPSATPSTPSSAPSTRREQRNETTTPPPSGREQQRTYEQPSVPERSSQPRTYTPPNREERPDRSSVTPSGRDQPRVYQEPPQSHSQPIAPRETPAQTHSAPVVRETPAVRESPAPPPESRGSERERDREPR